MPQRVLAVIPARLSSKRFSNKVIYPLNGKPLLYYVYNEISRARTVDKVVIATDNQLVTETARKFGAEVVLTSRRHQTGSDRVAEAASKLGGDIILNIQADSLGLKGPVLDRMVKTMTANTTLQYVTLVSRIENDSDLFNPDMVKVILDRSNWALWFSRYPLPYLQTARPGSRHRQFAYWGHIGVYGFRRRALERFATWKRTTLEKAESLEQLRVLENGGRMKVLKTTVSAVSINSPSDLKKLERIYK